MPTNETDWRLPTRLHFGIPSIDALIGDAWAAFAPEKRPSSVEGTWTRTTQKGHRFWQHGYSLPKRALRDGAYEIVRDGKGEPILVDGPVTSSVNIVGGDGSGKSLLALHMASAYGMELFLSDKMAKIIYVSSDLSPERAVATWEAFKLDKPLKRRIPFEFPGHSGEYPNNTGQDPLDKLGPAHYDSEGILELVGINPANLKYRPGEDTFFLPLTEVQPRSEEFYKRLRRSQVGEVLFLDLSTTTAGDDWGFLNRLLGCLEPLDDKGEMWPHMLIIDAVEGLETFVGDVDAYGLRSTRRSVIAQLMQLAASKCHVVLVNELNEDDKRLDEEFVTDMVVKLRTRMQGTYASRTIEAVKARGQAVIRGEQGLIIRSKYAGTLGGEKWPDKPATDNAYLHCFHSLDARDFRLARTAADHTENDEKHVAAFGIVNLDNMLGPNAGISRGQIAAIIGEEATFKAKLARAFIANCFCERSSDDRSSPWSLTDDKSKWDFAIYVTSATDDKDELLRKLRELVRTRERAALFDSLIPAMKDRLLIRNIEIESTSSSAFAHIFEELIAEAKFRWNNLVDHRGLAEIPKPRIRLVIDNLALIRRVHPAFSEDSRLIPHLARLFNQEQVTTLVVDNVPITSGASEGESPGVLQEIANRIIRTWHVPFFNRSCVAISAVVPSQDKDQAVVRELLLNKNHLVVDPHFELYADVDKAAPRLIPLQVMLRAHSDATNLAIANTERVLGFDFVSEGGKPIVSIFNSEQYDDMHGLAARRSRYQLDKTTVLQIDEFWAHSGCEGLYNLDDYFREEIDEWSDPRNSFHRRQDTPEGYKRRSQYFDDPLGSIVAHHGMGRPLAKLSKLSDRHKVVPYYWDLGFVLLDRHSWSSALEQLGARANSNPEVAYRQQYVQGTRDSLARTQENNESARVVSWRRFLRASQFVAGSVSAPPGHKIPIAFDTEMRSAESFCCLIFEMWFSEILITKRLKSPSDAAHFFNLMSEKSATCDKLPKLPELLEKYDFELYLVWLLLIEVLNSADFSDAERPHEFIFREAKKESVSCRHWYSSATDFVRDISADGVQIGHLPGHFTTRGDWFLGITQSSRSRRLGEKAIDLISSRRGNAMRLHEGVGLPVRRLHNLTDGTSFLRTSIPHQTTDGNELMTYEELTSATCPRLDEAGLCSKGFGWLWRSNICGYHSHSAIFSKWLCRTLGWMGQLKTKRSGSWKNGFYTYDRMRRHYDFYRRSFRDEIGPANTASNPIVSLADFADPELHPTEDFRPPGMTDDKYSVRFETLSERSERERLDRKIAVAPDESLLILDSFTGFHARCKFLIAELANATAVTVEDDGPL